MNRQPVLTLALVAILALTVPAAHADNPKGPFERIVDTDFYENSNPLRAKVDLGRTLFFDKIISGNMNISCATCHHSLLDTGDGLSLPVGEGGVGLGMTRSMGQGPGKAVVRVPRNAPALFNLGAREFDELFHDGRAELDPADPSQFLTPAGDDLPDGLDNLLAAQMMLPVTSPEEMAGQDGENPVGTAAEAGDLLTVWELLAQRLRDIPAYVDMFIEAFPGEVNVAADIQFTHAANAMAAFVAKDWRFTDTAFDRFVRGQQDLISDKEFRGGVLFFGRARCVTCHNGPYQTDHEFHAIAMPQVGPGKGDGIDGHDDFGRERVTGDPADRFTFRTPSLRQVALTGPWGHDGAYNSLIEVVRHHLDPVNSLNNWRPENLVAPPDAAADALDLIVMSDPARRQAIADANELAPVNLTAAELEDLLAFLHALTDPASHDLRRDVPFEVPSGLPVFD